MGTQQLYEKGGSFNFKVSYLNQNGIESEKSQPFFVEVKPDPLASPHLAKLAKPLKEEVRKKIIEKQ